MGAHESSLHTVPSSTLPPLPSSSTNTNKNTNTNTNTNHTESLSTHSASHAAGLAAQSRIRSLQSRVSHGCVSVQLQKNLEIDLRVQEERKRRVEEAVGKRERECVKRKEIRIGQQKEEEGMEMDTRPIPELEEALMEIDSNPKEVADSACKILSVILKNVLEKDDPMFRKLKIASKSITTLISIPGGLSVLKICGFEQLDDEYCGLIEGSWTREHIARCLFFISIR